MNNINTHLLICKNNKFDNCESAIFDILDINDINDSTNYKPTSNILLHEFYIYSQLYFKL